VPAHRRSLSVLLKSRVTLPQRAVRKDRDAVGE
jgi:hypothetical protein